MRLMLLGFVAVLMVASSATSQPPTDEKRLKAEIEALQKKLANLEKENELLKREIELMKKEAAAAKASGDGKAKDGAKAKTKATVDDVDYELLTCTRKGNKVTFTFSMVCEKGDRLMYGGGATPYGLIITASDGSKVKPTLTEGPNARIQLKKGITSKFQVIITGVDEDITEFGEVILHRGFGGADEDVHFYNIKPAAGKK